MAAQLVNQPTWRPVRKVEIGAVSIPFGASVATLIAWGLELAGISVPVTAATAIGGVISGLGVVGTAYMVRERAPITESAP